MNINEIIRSIKELACSKGFYSRLYKSIIELKNTDAERFAELAGYLEAQHFSDAVDMVLFFEG